MSERLTDEQLGDLRDCNPADPFIAPMAAELLALRARIPALEAALEDFIKWSEAYPTSIFVEPDYAKAHALLQAGGMTLERRNIASRYQGNGQARQRCSLGGSFATRAGRQSMRVNEILFRAESAFELMAPICGHLENDIQEDTALALSALSPTPYP